MRLVPIWVTLLDPICVFHGIPIRAVFPLADHVLPSLMMQPETFTFYILHFMHLADAFIQSDLHCIQVTVTCFPWESNPWSWRLLAPCSTSWATGKLRWDISSPCAIGPYGVTSRKLMSLNPFWEEVTPQCASSKRKGLGCFRDSSSWPSLCSPVLSSAL